MTRRFDVFFDLHPNKRLSKQWWGWWLETPSCPLRRHRNVVLFNVVHAMPITNNTHDACRYTAELGVSAKYFTHITPGSNHTAYMHVCMQGIGCVCIKNYPPKLMQPSSSTPATIVSAENQNDATIVKAIFFFCPYYIVWESNNAGEARKQSWNESLQSRCIPGGLCGLYEWYKAKTFCCAFFVAAMLTMVTAANIVRFPPSDISR